MNKKELHITNWLPTTLKEVKQKKHDYLDVILFTGDAYVDHPSFGAAIIGRVLENEGLNVAIIPQPNWQDDLRDFKKLGRPRLFFAVTSGNMDSMVNHYTANKRKRSNDAYTPEGRAGFRPDYATIVYSKILKNIFPDVPVILGGIEASLRRLAHYDYWSNSLKPSILIDSKADMLVYGNGEKAIIEIVNLMKKGIKISNIKNINQTAFLSSKNKKTADKKMESCPLNSYEDCLENKKKLAINFKLTEIESNKIHAKQLTQRFKNKIIVVNPPFPKTSETEIDSFYNLPFTYLPHPKYKKRGKIPAYEMIKFSINIHRGCFGGCSFCTISAHQGKFIVSRSERSILKEVDKISNMPDFKGYISDIGGPSANMYKMQGNNIEICKKCIRPSCINPNICKNLNTNHKQLIDIYKKIRNRPLVKKATIGSGIRHDMLFDANGNVTRDKYQYTEELMKYHISGRLKTAPEHTSEKVLKIMRKPSFRIFNKFKNLFDKINRKNKLNLQLIPYFISSHPDCTETDMAELAVKTKELNFRLEQIQDLTPTPMTLAAVIYYSGFHPYTMKKIYTARNAQAKLDQRMFFFWYKKEYKNKIKQKLIKINRKDLINKLFDYRNYKK